MGYDEFEPIRPSGDPASQPGQDGCGYYSTGGARPHHRRIGLIVGTSVLVVLCCAAVTVMSLFDFRVERDGGQVALYVSGRGDGITAQQPEAPETQASNGFSEAARDEAGQAAGAQTGGATLQISDTPAESGEAQSGDALSLRQVYQKVIGSVVSIISSTTSGSSSGTGIIMSEDGYIITNHHVIDNAAAITVLLQDNTEYIATLVGSDALSDLAVLKIDASGLQAAEFGDSDQLQVGDQVVAIGDPLGTQLRGTMTDGIVSAINRDLNYEGRTLTLIQTNAALNSGNSGGPLINLYGQVVGINTMKLSAYYTSATIEGLGFAIPIASAKSIIDELIQNGYVSGRPSIGISGQPVPAAAQAYYGLPAGVCIETVDPSSDAYAKGLRAGDIITGIEGTAIASSDELNLVKNQFEAGDTVTLSVYRSGRIYEVPITLAENTG